MKEEEKTITACENCGHTGFIREYEYISIKTMEEQSFVDKLMDRPRKTIEYKTYGWKSYCGSCRKEMIEPKLTFEEDKHNERK